MAHAMRRKTAALRAFAEQLTVIVGHSAWPLASGLMGGLTMATVRSTRKGFLLGATTNIQEEPTFILIQKARISGDVFVQISGRENRESFVVPRTCAEKTRMIEAVVKVCEAQLFWLATRMVTKKELAEEVAKGNIESPEQQGDLFTSK
jgi:hypothetical protein